MAKKKSKTEAALTRAALPQKSKQLVLLPTGSTLLNLAISQQPDGGWPMGTLGWLIGGSGSGKSMLGMTTLAEACQDSRFDDYSLLVDGPENGLLMNMAKFYGQRLVDRIRAPTPSGVPSFTLEEFYTHATDTLSAGPCILLLDSMDALTTNYDIDKAEERARVVRGQATEAKGDYGDGKAKYNSRNLRRLIGLCEKHNSLLLIISQTRTNLGDGFSPHTVSGGMALEFYAGTQLWLSKGRELKKTVNGMEYEIGVHSHIRISKNRVDGNRRKVSAPIYNTYGIDDTGSMIDWMVNRGFWGLANADGTPSKKGSCVDTGDDFGLCCTRTKLIRELEATTGWIDDLRIIVGEHWRGIEAKLAQQRLPRYA